MEYPGKLAQVFPNLTPDNSRKTSPENRNYNCIAWAASDSTRPWWPDADGIGYWPPGIPRETTIDAFLAAYASMGYALCENGEHEEGIEKIALYADADGRPTHAARQLSDGKWTSKIGQAIDIEHDSLVGVAGRLYGNVVRFLQRAQRHDEQVAEELRSNQDDGVQ